MIDSLAEETFYRSGKTGGQFQGYTFHTPVGRFLKSAGGWNSNGDGDGSSSFDVLPGGVRILEIGHDFWDLGYSAKFWTTSEGDSLDEIDSFEKNIAWYRHLIGRNNKFNRVDDIERYVEPRVYGYSIRCIKDDTQNPSQTVHLIKNQVVVESPLIKSEPVTLVLPKIF
jgi:uncharacterized protein (TIGR02145 family)